MPVSEDLLNRRFEKSGFGGYKAADVDSFMAEVAQAFSNTDREIADLKRKLDAAEKKLQKYESMEESMKNTLLNAQELASKIVREAQNNANMTIKKAQESADLTIRDAEIKAEKIIDAANREAELRKHEAETLKREITEFKLSVMRLYRSHLELINEIPSETIETIEEEPQEQPEIENDEQQVQDEAEIEQNYETEETSAENEPEAPEEEVRAAEEEAAAAEVTEEVPEPETEEEQPEESKNEEDEQEPAINKVKLNLRYNEKTGEYEPIDADYGELSDEGLQFGINQDSYDGSDRRRKRR